MLPSNQPGPAVAPRGRAYFSGIVSGSLHGRGWMVAAFAGNVLGTRVRPFFGLEVERTVQLTGC